MGREFKEGFLYQLEDLPYEGESGTSILCKHEVLCFGGLNYETTFFLVEEESDLLIADGGNAIPVADVEIGYWADDGAAKFVVCETDDQKGEATYVTVALLC